MPLMSLLTILALIHIYSSGEVFLRQLQMDKDGKQSVFPQV